MDIRTYKGSIFFVRELYVLIIGNSQAAIQVAILITDGREQDNTLEFEATQAKNKNITIFTIGIGNEAKIDYRQGNGLKISLQSISNIKGDFLKI